jgi:hypothetical protein
MKKYDVIAQLINNYISLTLDPAKREEKQRARKRKKRLKRKKFHQYYKSLLILAYLFVVIIIIKDCCLYNSKVSTHKHTHEKRKFLKGSRRSLKTVVVDYITAKSHISIIIHIKLRKEDQHTFCLGFLCVSLETRRGESESEWQEQKEIAIN